MIDHREMAAQARQERVDVLDVLRGTELPREAREVGHRAERRLARVAREHDKLADDAELLARLVHEGT